MTMALPNLKNHIILTSLLYNEFKLWRHMTRKNPKIARSPHILGRLTSVFRARLHMVGELVKQKAVAFMNPL